MVKEDRQEWVETEKKSKGNDYRKLSKQEIERIVSLLRESKSLPDDYKTVPFDTM